MKILLTADCVGGVWTYAVDLSRALSAAGDEVVVAVMGGTLAADQRNGLVAAGVTAFEERPFALEWMAGAEADREAAGEWLLDLAKRWAPDVVHCNQFDVAALAWLCPVLVVAHSDVVTWWRAVHGCDPGPEWTSYRERVAAGLDAADLVVAPTRAMLRDLTGAYDFATATRVIANGRSMAVPRRLTEPRIAAVGRAWDEAKNLRAAARAAAGLGWPLTVAGDGAADVEGAEWLGQVDAGSVADLLARSRVYIGPARYEPFGLAAVEAGLAGCALVLGDIPSLREVWGDAPTYVDPDDHAGMRAALAALIDDADLLHNRGAAARRRATTLDASTMAAAYAQAYRAIQAVAAGRVTP